MCWAALGDASFAGFNQADEPYIMEVSTLTYSSPHAQPHAGPLARKALNAYLHATVHHAPTVHCLTKMTHQDVQALMATQCPQIDISSMEQSYK